MENDNGSYKDVTDEKEVMDITTKTKHCVIHFYHSDFRRCMIVDKHLEVSPSQGHLSGRTRGNLFESIGGRKC